MSNLHWALGSVLVVTATLGQPRSAATAPHELTVFAASSLRESFEALAHSFEAQRRGTRVRLNFAGSQELRLQIEQGARADVFASADAKQMAALEKTGLVMTPRVFAGNQLVLVIPADNPANLKTLADLPTAKRIVLGAPEVPVGSYTEQVLDRATTAWGDGFGQRVRARVVSRELNARQVLGKVMLGEADAGIVYRTDAASAQPRVGMIALPAAVNVTAVYFIAVAHESPRAALAQSWITFVLSPAGQQRLANAGFMPVSATAHKAPLR